MAFASLATLALQVVGLVYAVLFGFQGLADEVGAEEMTFNRARLALIQDALPLLLTSASIAATCSFVIVRSYGWRSVLADRTLIRSAILLVPAFVIASLLGLGVGYLWHL
ncbi:hypothetical protein [Aeromicrobium sp.]|uniref:hypothetical protein n=1 Tax=Aeromicrobium sp. TaxID=1871063 RepID=UPI0030C3EC79